MDNTLNNDIAKLFARQGELLAALIGAARVQSLPEEVTAASRTPPWLPFRTGMSGSASFQRVRKSW